MFGPIAYGIGIAAGIWATSTIGGAIGGTALNLMGYFADFYKKHKKIIIASVLVTAIIFIGVFTLGLGDIPLFGVALAAIGNVFLPTAGTALASAVGAATAMSVVPTLTTFFLGLYEGMKKLINRFFPETDTFEVRPEPSSVQNSTQSSAYIFTLLPSQPAQKEQKVIQQEPPQMRSPQSDIGIGSSSSPLFRNTGAARGFPSGVDDHPRLAQ